MNPSRLTALGIVLTCTVGCGTENPAAPKAASPAPTTPIATAVLDDRHRSADDQHRPRHDRRPGAPPRCRGEAGFLGPLHRDDGPARAVRSAGDPC